MITAIKHVLTDPKSARKFIAALLGAVTVAVGVGLLPDAVGSWVAVVGAFLTSYGVYVVRNDTPKGGSNG